MKYLNPIDETARALAFLTRLPIPDKFFKNVKQGATNDCAGFYPAAGAIIGLIGSAILMAATILGLSPVLASTIAILSIIIVTGALHEDGLGDVADGFWGGSTIEKRLAIMKDSGLGTYGVLAITGSLLLRIACLVAIIDSHGVTAGACALIASSATSRAAMVWFWASLPNARGNGVAHAFGQPAENAVTIAAAIGLSIGAVFGLMASGFYAMILATVFSLGIVLTFRRLCLKFIGGQTGDTMGACQQLVEINFMIGLAIQLATLT